MKITQEEMKQKLHENALDVFVKVQPFYKSTSEAEADLQEAKSSAKKLIEKIDEYLESQKPDFKVGDYVTYEGVIENKIAKIDSINEDELHGLWYEQENEGIRQDWWLKGGHTVRQATPEEIEEYEVALNFHKHGRKPFEIKEDDILRDDKGNIFFVGFPNNFKKECFARGIYTFLKTSEEYNEWLENK